jgi:hypothetical protein
MAVKVHNGYRCGYCGALYNDAAKADFCRDSHELVYVQLTAKDLNSLLHFIYSRDEQFLTKSLMTALQRYVKGNNE